MSLTHLITRAQLGIDAFEVRVEVHISNGLPAFTVVGLPETAVREARDRVRSAIINSGFEFPMRRITVNLAPADLPKTGGRYDLAIALGILGASRQIEIGGLKDAACFGELALSGACCRVDGLLPSLAACLQAGQAVVIPQQNSAEASLFRGLQVRLTTSLAEVCDSLNGGRLRPAAGPARARDCRRRRTSHVDDGATRHRQEHAGAASDHDPAANERVRGDEQCQHSLHMSPAGESEQLASAPVSIAASHGIGDRTGWWRQAAATRRDITGA